MKVIRLREDKRIFVEDGEKAASVASIDAIDTAEDVADIADEIQEVAEVSDDSAKEVAKEVKDVGAAINADDAVVIPPENSEYWIGVKNRLTEVLDEALEDTLLAREDGDDINTNVLIVGLPGSSKTACVRDWVAHATPKVNLFEIDAQQDDLSAYLNGYTLDDKDDPVYVRRKFSKNLDSLELPNSVLFIDEFNRTKAAARSPLMRLINEHTIAGPVTKEHPDGRRPFKNLLFVIACINPAVDSDPTAFRLNQAERSRFTTVKFDSDPVATDEYVGKSRDKRIQKLRDKADPKALEKLERFLRQKDLGSFILNHMEFRYDSYEDLDDLDAPEENYTMFNQRVFTNLLMRSRGDKKRFLKFVDNPGYLLERTVDMLHKILADYAVPSFEDLCVKYDVDPETLTIPEPEAPAADLTADPEEDIEDDAELFANFGSKGTGSAQIKNRAASRNAIRAAIDSWDITH